MQKKYLVLSAAIVSFIFLQTHTRLLEAQDDIGAGSAQSGQLSEQPLNQPENQSVPENPTPPQETPQPAQPAPQPAAAAAKEPHPRAVGYIQEADEWLVKIKKLPAMYAPQPAGPETSQKYDQLLKEVETIKAELIALTEDNVGIHLRPLHHRLGRLNSRLLSVRQSWDKDVRRGAQAPTPAPPVVPAPASTETPQTAPTQAAPQQPTVPAPEEAAQPASSPAAESAPAGKTAPAPTQVAPQQPTAPAPEEVAQPAVESAPAQAAPQQPAAPAPVSQPETQPQTETETEAEAEAEAETAQTAAPASEIESAPAAA